jgi:hypothetical protein
LQWRCCPPLLASSPLLQWRCCPRHTGVGSHVIALVSGPRCEGAMVHVAAVRLCTSQVVVRRLPLSRWWRQLLWRSLHCRPRCNGAIAHVALASSSFPCRTRCSRPQHRARPWQAVALTLLPLRSCHGCIAVAPPLRRRRRSNHQRRCSRVTVASLSRHRGCDAEAADAWGRSPAPTLTALLAHALFLLAVVSPLLRPSPPPR